VGTVSQAITYYPQAVPHNNTSKRVFMHYMPWFEANGVQHGYTRTGSYGAHWTMANCTAQTNGLLNRVCADDTPLIGPYSSSDPYVIEYHLLLMKYSGIDGVVLDWGGVMDNGTDLPGNKINGEAMMAQLSNFGLKFHVMMEDRNYVRDNGPNDFQNPVNIADDTTDMANDLKCLAGTGSNCGNLYFNSPNYEKLPGTNTPVVGVFGPTTYRVNPPPQYAANGNMAYVWDNAYYQAGLSPSSTAHYTLWWQDSDISNEQDGSSAWVWAGSGAVGNSSWTVEDHMNYYVNNETAPGSNRVKMGAVVPAYYSYYQAGGWSADAGAFSIPFNNATNVNQLFDIVLPSNANYVQLVTWNDFGEGTEFEPTVSKGFAALSAVQSKLGSPYSYWHLELIKRLFDARVVARKANNSVRQAELDQASAALAALDIATATRLIDGTGVAATYYSDFIYVNGMYDVESVSASKCIDINGGYTADNTNVDLYHCNNSVAQQFYLWDAGGGSRMLARADGSAGWKCLDAAGTGNGANIREMPCNWGSTNSQKFNLLDMGSSQFEFESVASPGECIEIHGGGTGDGGNIDLWSCIGASNERWLLRGQQGNLRHGSGNCVHPLGGSSTPVGNTPAVLWNDCSTLDRIRYTLRTDGNIQHVSSGECLHPLGGVAAPGTQLVFFPACGFTSIAFRELPNGALQHKESGLCLTTHNGLTANGTNIEFTDNCSAAAFSFKPL
jgi:hypothetical protein